MTEFGYNGSPLFQVYMEDREWAFRWWYTCVPDIHLPNMGFGTWLGNTFPAWTLPLVWTCNNELILYLGTECSMGYYKKSAKGNVSVAVRKAYRFFDLAKLMRREHTWADTLNILHWCDWFQPFAMSKCCLKNACGWVYTFTHSRLGYADYIQLLYRNKGTSKNYC